MIYQQIDKNKRKTYLIFTIFFIILAGIGSFIGDFFMDNIWGGLIITLIVALVYTLVTYFQSTNIVMQMNGAKKVTEQESPDLWHIVEDLTMVADIPFPDIYMIKDDSPNAFATGRDPQHAAVAVTSGLYEMMNREELEGVLAHEISHVKNYDIRVSTISIALSSAIIFLSYLIGNAYRFVLPFDDDRDRNSGGGSWVAIRAVLWIIGIIFMILGPFIASIVQLAISRNREYLADVSGAELTRNPQGLINALEKLKDSTKPMKKVDEASASLYIDDPLKKKHFAHLFDTHPPLDDRIAALKKSFM